MSREMDMEADRRRYAEAERQYERALAKAEQDYKFAVASVDARVDLDKEYRRLAAESVYSARRCKAEARAWIEYAAALSGEST